MKDPLLDKLDALLNRHRGDVAHEAETSVQSGTTEAPGKTTDHPGSEAWLPVLTDVLVPGVLPAPAAVELRETKSVTGTESVAASLKPTAPSPETAASLAEPREATAQTPPAAAVGETPIEDTLAEQLLSELTPKLSEVMEKQVAAELRRNLDQTVSGLLAQLDVNVREIVREAIDEKLKHPRDH